jgi:hypothetical protein
MDTLHTVLRAIRGETKPQRRDHLQVFREFLGHLDRIGQRAAVAPPRAPKGAKPPARRGAPRGG